MSNTESMPIDLVLEMHEGDVPCVFELIDGCQIPAQYLIRLVHSKDDSIVCGSPEWVPMCPGHKEATRKAMTGFWAALMPPPPCDTCNEKISFAGVRGIKE